MKPRIELRRKNVFWSILHNMVTRCYCRTAPRYKDYGARGIGVCDEWYDKATGRHNLAAFERWCWANCWKPGCHVGRIDVDGDYTPTNCRCVSPAINVRIRRRSTDIRINGKLLCAKDLCKELGQSYSLFMNRRDKGWDLSTALLVPSGYRRPYKCFFCSVSGKRCKRPGAIVRATCPFLKGKQQDCPYYFEVTLENRNHLQARIDEFAKLLVLREGKSPCGTTKVHQGVDGALEKQPTTKSHECFSNHEEKRLDIEECGAENPLQCAIGDNVDGETGSMRADPPKNDESVKKNQNKGGVTIVPLVPKVDGVNVSEIYVFGRRVRVTRDGEVYALRPKQCTWSQLRHMRDVVKGELVKGHGEFVEMYSDKDRYGNSQSVTRPHAIPVATLKAIAFLSAGEDMGAKGMYVRHLDGDSFNDDVENLKWVTRDEHFKETVKRTLRVGDQYGLFTVMENVDREEISPQNGQRYVRSYVRCKCFCGCEELVLNPNLANKDDYVAACANCKQLHGSYSLGRFMLRHGLRAAKGTNCRGRTKYRYMPMPNDDPRVNEARIAYLNWPTQ